MFIVSPSNLMASFSGHPFASAASSSAALEIGQEAGDELNELHFQSLSVVGQKSAGGCGGLRRTVSSLHSTLAAAPSRACTHADYKSNCIVEAKQVEMDFATLSGQSFQLTVTAPNGEVGCYRFLRYGHTERFSPRLSGCGHGNWKLEIQSLDINEKAVTKTEESIYLDGVGSLFFTIDEQLKIRLASQEFLRLPSASQCCSNKH